MIQPLRTLHRRTFTTFAVVLPAILIVGLRARHPQTRAGVVPNALSSTSELLSSVGTQWQKHAIGSRFYRDLQHPDMLYVIFDLPPEMNEPDLLLYWSEGLAQGNDLPPQAELLGSLTTQKAFLLPRNLKPPGYLVLYSLAHHHTVDTAALERLP
jgi:hypothetical protein